MSEMFSALRQKLPVSVRRAYRDTRARLLSLGLRDSLDILQPPEERKASGSMSIIIPVKDAPEVTRRCFLSLQRFAAAAEIIVVDDASKLDETTALLAEFGDRNGWTVLRNSTSLGHSRSCEAGAKLATKPYLCLLNSDAIVTPWSWAAAKKAFEADPLIGVTGPSTSWSATEQTIPRAMHCRHYWSDAQIFDFAKQYVEKQPAGALIDMAEAGGFAFFIRNDLWKRLGGFDPTLLDYGNESELCKRVLKLGFRIVWTKDSYTHHLGSQTYVEVGLDVIRERSIVARKYINQKHG